MRRMDGAVCYRFRYEFTLAAEHEMRIGTISQEFVPLTLHRYITTRIVNVPSSERGSLRLDVCGRFQTGQRERLS